MVKLNPMNQENNSGEPSWLRKYDDIFPERLFEMPPTRKVDHKIKLVLGA